METKKDPNAPMEPKPNAAKVPPIEPEATEDAPALASILASEAPETEEAAAAAPPVKRRRGFAAMDRAKVRELARRGGAAAHAKGTAHRFTPEEAREAGRRGGSAPHRTRGTHKEGAAT